MIAFLGMGLLGENFTRALLKKGATVQVWNRTYSKAAALEAAGAKAFADITGAVRGADTIHITLRDDATVDEALAAATPGLLPGTTIIDHTTTSVAGAIERTRAWKERGYTYVHAPVFMGPQNALESTGTMLVSGDQQVIARVEPALAQMTGRVLNFGPETGRAAAMKLLGNNFLVCFTAGIADTMGLAKALHVPLNDLSMLFDTWNPGAMLPNRLKRMSSGDYGTPSWMLTMARKDTGLFMEEARQGGVGLTVIPAVAQLMDRYIAEGFGGNDWTVIAKDMVP